MKTWIAAVIAAATCTSALAADLPRKAIMKAPPPAWSGWYVGASAGYGFGSNNILIDPLNDAGRSGFISPSLGVHPKGALGGITLGVNWQAQNFVYGVETDLSYAAIKDAVIGPLLLPPYNFQTTESQRLEAFGTLRARAGFLLPNSSTLYATGGLAYGRGSVSNFAFSTLRGNCIDPNFCISGTSAQWKAGWTAGAGWEMPIARSWSAKAEYLYYDLGSVTNFMTDGLGPPEYFRGSAAMKGNILRLGVNYALGKG